MIHVYQPKNTPPSPTISVIHDISNMPSFMKNIKLQENTKLQDSFEREQRPVESSELYDELLDKFCYGSSSAGHMKRVLSKL